MPPVLPRLLLVLASTTLGLLVCESLLRSGLLGEAGVVPSVVTPADTREANWRQPGKPFVWRGQVGRPQEFQVHGIWNALGHNDADYPVEKPPATFRIVVLGDSYVEAVQVDPSRNFHSLLESRLNAGAPPPVRYEVISLGISGLGPRRSLERLREVGVAFGPDLVIEEFLGFNDVSDDSSALSQAFGRQRKRLRRISSRLYLPELWTGDSPWVRRLGLDHSRMATFLGQSWNDLLYKYRVSVLEPQDRIPHHWFAFKKTYDPSDPYDKAWIDGWKATPGYLRETKDLCDRIGARFLLVRFTDRWRVAPGGLRELYSAYPAMLAMEMDFERDRRMLEDLAAEEDIEYLDLFPSFRREWKKQGPLHFAIDTHWNEAGHRVAEEAVYSKLRHLGWVP